jgi:hypothetical protein
MTDLIHDRGRGPELVGTRITVQDLFPYFLDPTVTEAFVCKLYELTPEQVAAARAYVLNHPDSMLAQHLRVEARMAEGNPPEGIEQARLLHATFLRFKEWVAKCRQEMETRQTAERSKSESNLSGESFGLTFREWLATEQANAAQGS